MLIADENCSLTMLEDLHDFFCMRVIPELIDLPFFHSITEKHWLTMLLDLDKSSCSVYLWLTNYYMHIFLWGMLFK
jgi:hypothetical protein